MRRVRTPEGCDERPVLVMRLDELKAVTLPERGGAKSKFPVQNVAVPQACESHVTRGASSICNNRHPMGCTQQGIQFHPS